MKREVVDFEDFARDALKLIVDAHFSGSRDAINTLNFRYPHCVIYTMDSAFCDNALIYLTETAS
jgi:hypothetical protein